MLFIVTAAGVFAKDRRIIGTGPNNRVMAYDMIKYEVGDYMYRSDEDYAAGKKYYINQGDMDYAKSLTPTVEQMFMVGFAPTLPDVDDGGREFVTYVRSEDYSRKLYDDGGIEDVITASQEYDEALTEFKRKYSMPIPRDNPKIVGANNWLYLDTVKYPSNTFWASITLEGRVMKVVVANGLGHKLAISYWATPEFMSEYPTAKWSWAGLDKNPGKNVPSIQEDITAISLFEYTE
ncbi:hypothetical protein FACS1894130_05590 [Spirochaetia bacterium]|nr:hypothetical protein FACS1894130_05590 [Spirochaetia bacterium]